MIIVEYEKFSKGRVRTHEVQVDRATVMKVDDGALILSTSGGTILRVFAQNQWSNAALLEEVVITNQLGEVLVKEPLVKDRAFYGVGKAAA